MVLVLSSDVGEGNRCGSITGRRDKLRLLVDEVLVSKWCGRVGGRKIRCGNENSRPNSSPHYFR